MIVVFDTAVFTEYMDIDTDRLNIAKKYLRGWFLIDFVAIFPFQLLMNNTNLN